MSIIQEITKKYNGKYSENPAASFNSPSGKYSYQPKNGIINIDGSKVSINLNEVSDAMYGTEPFRITLYLDKAYQTELNIFPKDLWNKLLDFLFPKRRAFIPQKILKQFWFGGDKKLIRQITSDKQFNESIIDERIYIETMPKKSTDRIVLTPERGINDIEQFEKFIDILKQIENKIKNST
ncbi:hypothetical protein [Allomuricauda sp. SCSIO 65647]|uniref:hypothetical protein n=1 Tax=Allomuricauda sp. SCSIO 65647 TaxID=2908843 RepID=UPI001F15EC71|nr:hypothetical protein [Muricauda sp. SCSIO 65647]UJH66489.1 hypothetical protein L0P89_10995 [Muricauda sp. SCSIO 65647]